MSVFWPHNHHVRPQCAADAKTEVLSHNSVYATIHSFCRDKCTLLEPTGFTAPEPGTVSFPEKECLKVCLFKMAAVDSRMRRVLELAESQSEFAALHTQGLMLLRYGLEQPLSPEESWERAKWRRALAHECAPEANPHVREPL
eukprot:gnl/Spiro4/23688_TR11713_c0_g1_i1.p1 gnl/Spiro4/23688_TR11713_c0_g1~~gnl/Spiro4/23688_TR11713_c0_g1_i1.p1  ORF type:complete len:159 (+),score=45.35 gnl/Spiro4/23688_TR11713_c0_g1_i1:51-479(+)